MPLSSSLLAVIACPEDKTPLAYDAGDERLSCPACERVFPVIDGIPVLLPAGEDADA